MNVKLINRLLGFSIFLIAFILYFNTVETTASFWDCSEYIASGYKMQVPHSPGAPLYILICRFFSLFAVDSLAKVSFYINITSVLFSAITAWLTFEIIMILGLHYLRQETCNAVNTYKFSSDELKNINKSRLGAVIGSLCLIVSDTFWRISTETEVYSISILITVLTIWSILKWQLNSCDNRWLILSAYLIGLSLGTRLFCLLTIPALTFIIYVNNRKKIILKDYILGLGIGFIFLFIVYNFILLGIPTLIMWVDIISANLLNFRPNTGGLAFVILSLIILLYYLYCSITERKKNLNLVLACILTALVGYSTYIIVPIRAVQTPSINEGNPSNIPDFVSYLKREQYQPRPLLWGNYYSANIIEQRKDSAVYALNGHDKYYIKGYKIRTSYDKEHFFPRIWSTQYPIEYKQICNIKDNELPNFLHNITYFIKHQLGHFYLRYFLWNFSGRLDDLKGSNWSTPLSIIDQIPQSITGQYLQTNFFFFPLLIGILGLITQYRKDKKFFCTTVTLFVMLGVALNIYINHPPIEPRERDYIYVGSFLIFTIWIGLGTIKMISCLEKILYNVNKHIITYSKFLFLIVPFVMFKQGIRAHKRSNKYIAVDYAKNILSECAPNAILFTAGDNDTFPLWYVQEVEGFRKDVRVIVLSYLNTDWYIKQLRHFINDSLPVKLTLNDNNYVNYGLNDQLYFMENEISAYDSLEANLFLKLIKQESKKLQVKVSEDDIYLNTIPSRSFYLNVDKDKAMSMAGNIVPYSDINNISTKLNISLKNDVNVIFKKDLALLDIIISNICERPIYFNQAAINDINFNLNQYLVCEGLTVRCIPINTGHVTFDTNKMYTNLIHSACWKNLDSNEIYYDQNERLFIINYRSSFNLLASALIHKKEFQKAAEVLNKSLIIMPDNVLHLYDFVALEMIDLLFMANCHDKALEISTNVADRALAIMNHQAINNLLNFNYYLHTSFEILDGLIYVLNKAGQTGISHIYDEQINEYANIFNINITRY